MPIVEVDGIGRVTFPDEMSEADISSAINDHFKQVGVEQSINASMLPSRILTTPGVAEASAGARRFARIDRVRQLQEQRSPSEWTLEPETIAGIEQGVRPFQNPVKGAIQAGISGVAAAQRALGLPAYEPDRPILPPGVAKNAVEALAGAIPGESYGELGEGVRGASADLIGGFTPSDIAMFSPGGGIGYANEMSQAAPETAARFGQKLGEGNVPEATKAAAELAFTGLAPLSIMGHTGRSLMPSEPYVAPFTGRDLVKPRGSRMRVEPTQIAVNSPEAARVLGNQMQREATGVDFNPARRLPKAQVPEVGVEDPAQGIAEPEEKAVGLNLQAEIARRNNARTKADIQKLFPGMNRQQAAEVRNVAWGDPRTGALEAEPLENAPGEVPVEGVNQALAEDRNGEGSQARIEESAGQGVALRHPTYQSALDEAESAGLPSPFKSKADFNKQREAELEKFVEEPVRDLVRQVWKEGGKPFSSNAFGPGDKGVHYIDASGNQQFKPLATTKGIAPAAVRENGGKTSLILPDGTAYVGGRFHGETFDAAVARGATEDQLANATAAFTRDDGTSWDLQGNPVKTTKTIDLSVPETKPNLSEAPAESVPTEAPAEPAQPELPQAKPEPEKPPVAEPPVNLGDDFKSFLDQQAEEALKRISERRTTQRTNLGGMFAELPNAKDYTIYAASRLLKYGVRGAEWTADMIKTFGKEEITPHLDALYQAALDHINAAKTEFKPAAAGPTTPVEILSDAYSNKKGNTGIANTAGMAAKTIAHLDELKAKMLEERKRSKELGAKAKTAATTAEKIKLGAQALGVEYNAQYHLEAIETAADFMSNRESPVTKLGPRPLDWRKNPEVAEWIRTHSHELYPEENTYGLLPDELKAKAAEEAKPEAAPDEPPAATTAIDPRSVKPVELPVDQLKLSKDVPNFKGGANEETGVVTGQELSGTYEKLGTAPIVVWQRLNGDLEVITGRHRLDLARRTGEKTIPAQVVKEAKGFTKDQAITFDAEANIRDGQGEVSDYATYFKGTEISEAEARARGLLSRAKGKAGWVLAKNAADDLYASWRAGNVTDAQAVAIAEGAPGNAGAQRVGIKLAAAGKSPEIISGVLRRASQVTSKAENLDLFGADDTAIKQMEADEAKASGIRKGIQDQIAAVQGAAKRPEAAAKLGVNVKDPAGVIKKVTQLKGELDRWANWWLHPDLAEQVRPTPKPTVKPKAGGDLFGGDTPFNLTGETQTVPKPKPTVAPKVDLTGFGAETLAQHELFSIEQVVESKDPTKSADAAQKLYGGAREAAIKLKQQLATIDADPKTAKTFSAPQRAMLANVIALLRERGAKEGGTIHDALNKAAQDALDRIDERTRRSNTDQSMRPDLGIGEGIANFKDYTIYGAAKLVKYGLDKAAWWADMLKTFGPKIKDLREDLFKAAQQHYADYKAEFSSKGKPTSVQEVINRSVGVERGPIDSTMSAMEALQTGLRTVRALRDHFKGQPKVSRDEVKAADDWLEGDANRIRQGLTDLVKRELPPEERGRFITAINNASRRSPILTGDPEAMYRRAAEVAARIEDRAQEVRKNDAISGIKAALTRALDSPGVDIGYKNRILDLFKRVGITKPTADTLNRLQATRDYLVRMAAEGKDVEIPKEILDHLEVLTKIPLRDLPLNAVQALADKIAHLEQLGRLKVKAREQVWEIEKQSHMATLPDERTTPLEDRTQFAPQPGDPTTPSMKIRNWLIRLMNGASKFDKAYLPQDAVFDMLGDSKGGYRGWLFRHIRGPLDLAFNDYSVLRDAVTDPISKLVEKYKMGQREAERINTYARAMQEGGIERLIAQGVDPATIDKIIETFTTQERHVYSEMRKAMDGLLPQMQKLMHELYNIEVKPVENYWPLPRDWEAMRHLLKPADMKEPAFGEPMTFDDLAGWKDMFADFVAPKSTQAERGSTIERKPKAMTPVQNNAFDVFYQHINDVAYLLKTQRDLKMAGEMARTDEFAGKYGKLGQALVLDFLDTFARQGRLGGLRRIPWLDELRTRTAVGIIGFRVASNLVHASNVAFSIERAGIRNFSAAAMEIASGKADEFMRKNFAEAFSRGGGEPALVEAAAKGSSVFGQPLVSKNVARASMAAARAIDRFNAEATMLGVYFKELRAKGIDPATYQDIPIDKEAQAHAMVMARRAIASPLPKDVPSAISRGSLTGGNISLGKTVMQFQNIFADQWSNLRHDLWRAGIRGKDPVKVARMTLAIMGVVALETGIRETVKAGISSVTGKKQKEEDLQGAIIRETARRFPLGGQATAAILYDSSGVPMVDAFWDPAKEAYRSAKAKSPQKQNQHAIKAVTGAGQLMGLPVGQLGEVVADSLEK